MALKSIEIQYYNDDFVQINLSTRKSLVHLVAPQHIERNDLAFLLELFLANSRQCAVV